MWDFISDVATSVWDVVTGFGSSIWNGFKWLIHRMIGLLEWFWTILGFMPVKKFRLRVWILLDQNQNPTATRSSVDDVVNRAQKVFKDQANVKIVSPTGSGDRLIVGYYPGPAPDYVMDVPCAGSFWQVFTKVGKWFRARSARHPAGSFFGYGSPATIFVVRNVQGKDGCFIPIVTDYGYIDPDALHDAKDTKVPSDGELLTLAHELGHACDLRHRSNGSLMEEFATPRNARLIRRERATLRSSPRVTYL